MNIVFKDLKNIHQPIYQMNEELQNENSLNYFLQHTKHDLQINIV